MSMHELLERSGSWNPDRILVLSESRILALKNNDRGRHPHDRDGKDQQEAAEERMTRTSRGSNSRDAKPF